MRYQDLALPAGKTVEATHQSDIKQLALLTWGASVKAGDTPYTLICTRTLSPDGTQLRVVYHQLEAPASCDLVTTIDANPSTGHFAPIVISFDVGSGMVSPRGVIYMGECTALRVSNATDTPLHFWIMGGPDFVPLIPFVLVATPDGAIPAPFASIKSIPPPPPMRGGGACQSDKVDGQPTSGCLNQKSEAGALGPSAPGVAALPAALPARCRDALECPWHYRLRSYDPRNPEVVALLSKKGLAYDPSSPAIVGFDVRDNGKGLPPAFVYQGEGFLALFTAWQEKFRQDRIAFGGETSC